MVGRLSGLICVTGSELTTRIVYPVFRLRFETESIRRPRRVESGGLVRVYFFDSLPGLPRSIECRDIP